MKILFTLVFVALVLSCQAEEAKETSKIAEISKCLLEKGAPLSEEILKLVEAAQTKDFDKIIEIATKPYQEGKAIFLECVTKAQTSLETESTLCSKSCLVSNNACNTRCNSVNKFYSLCRSSCQTAYTNCINQCK